jgi:imidazolonepropionase-like amidohydrolase
MTTVIRCDALIDGHSDRVAPRVRVLIEGSRIAAIGPDVPEPPGAELVEAPGATWLPGLIDLNAHLMYQPGTLPRDSILRSSARKTLDGLRNAATMLRAGFTTCRCLGDIDAGYGLVEIRDAIARGDFPGPRLLVAPHFLSATGGHGDLGEIAPDAPPLSYARIVDGAEAMRRAIREEVKYGADWIKLFVSGGILSSGDSPHLVSYSQAELEAAVEETHRLGRKIAVHAMGAASVTASLRAGVDDIEHGWLIDDEGIELLRRSGASLVPTAYVARYLLEHAAEIGLGPESVAKATELVAERDGCLRKAFAAGIAPGFGTDNGPWPHHLAWREFEELVRIGLTPFQAIQAATTVAARTLGLSDQLGTIEAGKQADLVATDGNPLEDITALGRIRLVIQRGRVVIRDTSRPSSESARGGK